MIPQSTPNVPLSPHEPSPGGGGGGGGPVGEGISATAAVAVGGPAAPVSHNSFVTDNNMNTSAKGLYFSPSCVVCPSRGKLRKWITKKRLELEG